MIWEENEDIVDIRCANRRSEIQKHLDACREERRPYVFTTSTMKVKPLHRILVPVTRLEEEVYKAEICTYLARKTGAHLLLLQANDYGSRAKQNTQKIITHIRSIAERTGEDITYELIEARKDSSKLHIEAVERQRDWQYDLLLLTASREYGMDDILFGPPERKAIEKALVPVMLINPREDLFSLCD